MIGSWRPSGQASLSLVTLTGRIWSLARVCGVEKTRWILSVPGPAQIEFGTADVGTVGTCRTRCEYTRSLPTTSSNVHVLYFDNLRYRNNTLTEVPKPHSTPHFRCYDDYFRFLKQTAQRLASNMSASQRRYVVHPKFAGCTQAVTIKNSTSLWRGSDSGEDVARGMGLSCRVYQRRPQGYRREDTLWAAAGLAGGLNLTVFDYAKPLCLLFTGCYGDKVWDRCLHDLSVPVGDRDALIGEFRLFEGIFHCVVPWWGIRHTQEINGDSFGMVKKDTSSNVEFLWPFSREDQAAYRQYLKQRGHAAPGPLWIWVIRKIARFEKLFHRNFLQRFGVGKCFRPWTKLVGTRLLFQWANHELKKKYEAGLKDIGLAVKAKEKG